MLDKLLRSLYSALDKAPGEFVALRVHHQNGLCWRVRDRTLTAAEEIGGAAIGEYNLEALTISQLSDALQADGCEVSYENTDVGSFSASILMDATGCQTQPNGDAMMAYGSLLWAILDAYAYALEIASAAVDAALLEIRLETANGFYLDFWGSVFGISRPVGFSDSEFRAYIVEEVTRLKNNGYAIHNTLLRKTGVDIEVFEPWTKRFILDGSTLSSDHHFTDSHYYNYHIIHPISRVPIHPARVIEIVDKCRAAGVEIYHPMVRMPAAVLDASIESIASEVRRLSGSICRFDEPLLDFMFVEDRATPQYEFLRGRSFRNGGIVDATSAITISTAHERLYRSQTSMLEYLRDWNSDGWSDYVDWTSPVTILPGLDRLS